MHTGAPVVRTTKFHRINIAVSETTANERGIAPQELFETPGVATMERDHRSVGKRVTPPDEALEDLVFAFGNAGIGLQNHGEWREWIALYIRERRVQFVQKPE